MLIVSGTNLLTHQLAVAAKCYSLVKRKKGEFERYIYLIYFLVQLNESSSLEAHASQKCFLHGTSFSVLHRVFPIF